MERTTAASIGDPHDQATAYLQRHLPRHLDEQQLVNNTAAALATGHPELDESTRQRVAIRALAAIQAGRCPHYIDLDESTSQVLFIRNEHGGRSTALSIHDLLQAIDLLRQQREGTH